MRPDLGQAGRVPGDGHDRHGQDEHARVPRDEDGGTVSEHEHDPDEHDPASHGRDPLTGVDAGELHAAVDELAATLHAYVETAVGVRAEFSATESDEDPRVLAIEQRVGALNAQLYDLLHARLGLHADLTGMTWDDREDEDHAPAGPGERDTFHLGFVVELPATVTDLTLDAVLDLVDDGGGAITERLAGLGYVVGEWSAARGGPVMLDGEDDDEDEE